MMKYDRSLLERAAGLAALFSANEAGRADHGRMRAVTDRHGQKGKQTE